MFLFADGFDDLSVIDEIERRWDNHHIAYDRPSVWESSNGRLDTGAIKCNESTTSIRKNFTPSSEVIFGFAFKFDTNAHNAVSGFCKLFGTGEIGQINLYAEGQLQWEGYSSAPDSSISYYKLKPNNWYYIETRIVISNTGLINIKVNGIDWINEDPFDTLYTGGSQGIQLRLQGSVPTDKYFWFDDVYIYNGEGTKNNTFSGNSRVTSLKPNGAGNYAQFTPSAGNNYECVDDVDWSGINYVESEINEQTDTHLFEDLPVGLGAIRGIQICNGSKCFIESDTSQMKHVIRKNSTDYISAAKDLTDDIHAAFKIYEEDPEDSQDWTKAKIDVSEFGYQSVIP